MPPLAAGVWPPDNLQYQTNILLPQTKSSHVKVALLLVLTWSCFTENIVGKKSPASKRYASSLGRILWQRAKSHPGKSVDRFHVLSPWHWTWMHLVLHLCARTFFGHSRPGKHKPNKFGKKAPERVNVSEEHSIFGNPLWPGLGGIWRAAIRIGCVILFRSCFHQPQRALNCLRQEAPLHCSHCTSLHFRGRTRGALWCTKCWLRKLRPVTYTKRTMEKKNTKNGKVCAELHNNDLPLMNSISRFSSGKMWNTKVVDGLTFWSKTRANHHKLPRFQTVVNDNRTS